MDGTPQLTETQAGSRIFFRGRHLYPDPPATAARAKALQIPLAEGGFYLLCSPLLWYGVSELARRLPKNAHLAILECDPALRSLCDWHQEWLGQANRERIHLIPAGSAESMAASLSACLGPWTRKIHSLGLNAGRLLNQSTYNRICVLTEQELRRYWRNRSTLLFMGRLWTRNLISNLAARLDSAPINQHSRHPNVVVVGAGPSLDPGLVLLREHRSAIFLVAVDTALPTLCRNNLVPDLVVAVEGQVANLRDFLPGGLDYPALAFDLTGSPLLPRRFRFRKLWHFVSDYAPGRFWHELEALELAVPRIPALGSVGVAALYLCRYLCSGRAFILGLDFAWSAGATHASDSPSRLQELASNQRISNQGGETASLREGTNLAIGADGTRQYSDALLESYRDSLDEVIGCLRSDGLTVHDLRNTGLPLAATPCDGPEFERLLKTETPCRDLALGESARSLTDTTVLPPDPANRGRWLGTQVARIETCLAAISTYNHKQDSPGAPPDSAGLLALLAELDFFFVDIPDQDWPSLEPAALARARLVLDYYRDFILQRS